VLGYLFSLNGPVSRGTYAAWGVALMALKYVLESAVSLAFTGQWLSADEFLLPLLSARDGLSAVGGTALIWVLAAISLPFLWIGVAFSLRRAEDAGLPAVVGCGFVFPFVNWLLIVFLALVPSRPPSAPVARSDAGSNTRSALVGVAIGTLISVVMVALSTLWLGEYSSVLFFATPFILGASIGYVVNRNEYQTMAATLFVTTLGLVVAGGALLLFALEGVLCIIMAGPLAFAAAAFGAAIGRHLAPSQPLRSVLPVLLGLPLAAGIDAVEPRQAGVREVISAVVVDAPPEAVWRLVLAFPPLPPPSQLLFRAGVAYPTRAVLDAPRVGAVRRCEFSTGAFIEPITAIEPPRRLAFDVTEQPAPLRELSPYGALALPHLGSGMRAERGEFRLIPLSDGRTRLEGSTWYRLGLEPSGYWALWTDFIIHAIHTRVLEHIAHEAESRRSG
jgi:hypothetical protein